MSLVLKSFINNLFIMKSRDLSCDCLTGSTSRPYNKIDIHFVDTSWRITSSDAICPIFPKILLNLNFVGKMFFILFSKTVFGIFKISFPELKPKGLLSTVNSV